MLRPPTQRGDGGIRGRRHRLGAAGVLLPIASIPASLLTLALAALLCGGASAGPGVAGGDAAAKRFLDNGDGTISDHVTGLMWEKKCVECGPTHSLHDRYRWSGDGVAETIWDWLDGLNGEAGNGFAGHSDWRVPSIKELVTIVEYATTDPAVVEAFHGPACADRCSDAIRPRCSCTHVGEYWTSTTFADFPAHALVVRFGQGFVDDRLKTELHFVRAVRGGR